MTYQPPDHQPPHPPHGWQPAPTPPAPRRAGWQTISLVVFSALVLCCGGAGIISTFTGTPDQRKAAGLAGTPASVPHTGRATEAVATTPATTAPTTGATTPPATRSTSPTPAVTPTVRRTSSPATRPATRKPTPKPTTKKPKPKPVTEEPDPEPEAVHYRNCTAVRAAGADPIRRGDPGYARHLDRDGDGVGCE